MRGWRGPPQPALFPFLAFSVLVLSFPLLLRQILSTVRAHFILFGRYLKLVRWRVPESICLFLVSVRVSYNDSFICKYPPADALCKCDQYPSYLLERDAVMAVNKELAKSQHCSSPLLEWHSVYLHNQTSKFFDKYRTLSHFFFQRIFSVFSYNLLLKICMTMATGNEKEKRTKQFLCS